MKSFKNIPIELCFLVLAIILLAIANPTHHHFTLCPAANLGFEKCPGCGLGRSISAILNGDVYGSFKYHWFGIPALLIIAYRCWQLAKQLIIKQKKFKKYQEA